MSEINALQQKYLRLFMLFSLEMKKNDKKEMSIVGHDEHGFVLQLVQNSG